MIKILLTSISFLVSSQSLASLYSSSDFDNWYYKKSTKYKGWKYIVLHHSATNAGSVKGFHRYHTEQGYGGIAYHYVIGNGKGLKDGEVVPTFRWEDQISGTHVTVDSWEYNVFGIGICLVGNFEDSEPTGKQMLSLKKLISKLQKRHSIADKNVIAHSQVPFDAEPEKKQKSLCPGKILKKKLHLK